MVCVLLWTWGNYLHAIHVWQKLLTNTTACTMPHGNICFPYLLLYLYPQRISMWSRCISPWLVLSVASWRSVNLAVFFFIVRMEISLFLWKIFHVKQMSIPMSFQCYHEYSACRLKPIGHSVQLFLSCHMLTWSRMEGDLLLEVFQHWKGLTFLCGCAGKGVAWRWSSMLSAVMIILIGMPL